MKVTKLMSKNSYEVDDPNQVFITVIYRVGVIAVILMTAVVAFYSVI